MNTVYKNNNQIIVFIKRAQNKIADLSTLIVDRGGDYPEGLYLLLELSNFIDELDSKYCDWEEDDILRWIHEYNYRADLNSIPYIDITEFDTTVIIGDGTTIGLPITTSDISDYIIATNRLIRATPHNQLSQLQGGTTGEMYHMTKEMYDYLDNLLHPKTPSTVSINVQAPGVWPSGYYELGTSLSPVVVTGYINYNYYQQASFFEYRKNGALIGVRNGSPKKLEQPNPYTLPSPVTGLTNISFSAMFEDGNKTADTNIIFRQPMYYGIISNNQSSNTSLLVQGTKDVRDRGEMNLTFNIASGNTLITDGSHKVPYLLIPSPWGRFTSAFVGIFDFGADWTATTVQMPLLDGTTLPAILLTYNTQVEGVNTFRFNW